MAATLLPSRSLPAPRLGALSLCLLGIAGLACGDDSLGLTDATTSADTTGDAAGDDTDAPDTAAGESAATTTTAGPDGSGSEGDSSTSTTSDAATTGDGETTGDATATTGDTGVDPGPMFDGEPLPDAPPGEWNWIDIPEARCIDGSKAGIGVRYGISDELVIFFEGGGGCFNDATCGLFYASFAHFDQLAFDLIWQNTILQGGIFDTDNPNNPVRDWNFVYVPYCTGDVHIGDAPDTFVPGYIIDEPQQFVGFRNVHHFLDRVVPTFDGASHVLVTGISAGGFGAAFNYDRIADAFTYEHPDARVTLIDDSGPPLGDDWLAPCLQQRWRDLYNLGDTIPADCDDCFQPDGGGISNLGAYIANKHHDQTLGLISSERDLIIRTFFGYGLQKPGGEQCPEGIFELPMNGDHFEAGIYALRDGLAEHDNWGSYLMGGTSHTYLSFLSYYTKSVNGILLIDWIRNMLEGQTSHVSP
ncbi:MAG: hypothetical protein H6713_17715 [Myxococcales bacterium]|nr:hypothetical protein [Myxococcales bacterium]MCB9751815.1 hypothetical protein [Myxococcales bacterium]